MKRRHFIRAAGAAASIPLFFQGTKLNASAKPLLFNQLEDENDRVLVLIQLNGGNDGLNTLIPLDQYDNLFRAREAIIVPESSTLNISDTLGFHPVMTGVQEMFQEGKVGIIQNIGYPNQNRSHFRSTEIWSTASSADEFLSTGWLGRYFDEKYPGFPDAYPREQFPDPFAITLGNYVSDTCQGQVLNYSLATSNPFDLIQLPGENGNIPADPFFSDELAYIKEAIAQTNIYSESLVAAAERGNSLAVYPDTSLARRMRSIAYLISGGLQTKVYIVNFGGFDTHALQVDGKDPKLGNHADLLRTLSDAVAAFQQDLNLLGLEERVIGMTYSEFGRQIRANGSNGTDHGTAAPLFLFGPCTGGLIIGQNPEIPEEVDNQAGVPMQYDFRDVYGSVLMDWFGLPEEDVKRLLHQDFVRLPILQTCQNTTSVSAPLAEELSVECFPNPFRDWTNIRFDNPERQWVRLSIFDALGHELKVLSNQQLPPGEHTIQFDGHHLPAGNYYFRLVLKARQTVKRGVKIAR